MPCYMCAYSQQLSFLQVMTNLMIPEDRVNQTLGMKLTAFYMMSATRSMCVLWASCCYARVVGLLQGRQAAQCHMTFPCYLSSLARVKWCTVVATGKIISQQQHHCPPCYTSCISFKHLI